MMGGADSRHGGSSRKLRALTLNPSSKQSKKTESRPGSPPVTHVLQPCHSNVPKHQGPGVEMPEAIISMAFLVSQL